VDRKNKAVQILWGSPLPPTRSGVADYAVEVLPELASLATVRVLRPPNWSHPVHWPAQLEVVPTNTEPRSDEIAMIHLGNNPHHLWLLDHLRREDRTVVVLHDTVLHHLLVESTAAVGDHQGFIHALESTHGVAGHALATARAVGHHGHLDPFLFPANGVFLESVRAVLVHSRWAENLIRLENPEITVGRVGLTVADPYPTDREAVRARLGLQSDEVILMHLGFLTPEKGFEEILTGVAAANKAGVAARLVVVGEGEGMEPLRLAAANAGVADWLVVTGWVEPELLPGLPAAADLGVVFRTPSAGETSAAVLRFFACGVPVAVGGVRQFLEWPEPAAPRLTPGPSAPAELARLLSEVGATQWGNRCSAARECYEGSHRPERAARDMLTFVTTFAGRP
jgi:glycosyltransferase involved in cell wall biosynthesis